jgi:hypothetical protein
MDFNDLQKIVSQREDRPLYSPLATQEALANALCHRDYAMSSSITSVAMYDDRLEIVSPDSLHFELTPQVTPQVTERILTYCQEARKAGEIQGLLALKDPKNFRSHYLRPLLALQLLALQLLALTRPDKPRSRFQQYIITDLGKKWLADNALLTKE